VNTTGLDCKVVVPGEPHHKLKCVRADALQLVRDAQTFNVVLHNWHRESRAGYMNAWSAFPDEQRDDTGQAFGPIAGPESLVLRRHAADNVMVIAIVSHVGGIIGARAV
jgi:hypothetical protein